MVVVFLSQNVAGAGASDLLDERCPLLEARSKNHAKTPPGRKK
jgi:hypothetical protein